MKINILTIFPELYNSFLCESIIGRAIASDKIEVKIIDIRDYTANKHKKVDDYLFGGGAGMLLTPGPIASAIESNNLSKTMIINTSPRGQVLTQALAKDLSEHQEITILVGRYEGIDQRIIDKYVNLEVSIGDYILTGGEIASQVIIESVVRLLPNVLSNCLSSLDESFTNGLLEEDHYTRPQNFEGLEVPSELLSGHHLNIAQWKIKNRLKKTYFNRPDLLDRYKLNDDEQNYIEQLKGEKNEENKN